MSRDAQAQAKKTFNESQDQYNKSNANRNALYDTLVPYYQSEATNPQGFDPQDLADMNTSAQQSVGGSVAGAEGAGAETAARTRNEGSFLPVLAEANREGQRTLADQAVGTKVKNAMLREGHRQEGVAGLGDLESQQNSDVLASLGLSNQSTDTLIRAGQSGWFQNMLGLMNAGANVAKAVSGFPQFGSKPNNPNG